MKSRMFCRALIEAIPVAAHFEAQQAADQQSVAALVRNHQHASMSMGLNDTANDGQDAIEDIQPRFAAGRW